MKIYPILFIFMSAMLLSACGSDSGDSGSSTTASGTTTTTSGSSVSSSSTSSNKYDGKFSAHAVSDTTLSPNGLVCGFANGTITINNSRVSGNMTTNWGEKLVVSGDVSSNGGFTAGLATQSGENVANYKGTLHSTLGGGTAGDGTWIEKESGGCKGTWSIFEI